MLPADFFFLFSAFFFTVSVPIYQTGDVPSNYVALLSDFSGSFEYDGIQLTIKLNNAIPEMEYSAYASNDDTVILIWAGYLAGIKGFRTDASGKVEHVYTEENLSSQSLTLAEYDSLFVYLNKRFKTTINNEEIDYIEWQIVQIVTPYNKDFPNNLHSREQPVEEEVVVVVSR